MLLDRTSNRYSFAVRYLARRVLKPSRPASLAEAGLFTGAPQHETFASMDNLAPIRRMPASSTPTSWPVGPPLTLPPTYEFAGRERSSEQFLTETDTSALLVIVDGAIRLERYLLTGGPSVRWLSMSVAKSFISALVGIALQEGHIAATADAISDYVPVRPGSAYDGVSILDVLQMSSGARWNEDYNDPHSDIHRLTQAMMGRHGGLDGFVARMAPQHPPQSVCRYNSGETQILGALIAHATGRTVADYMTEKLVEPLGFETPGFWVTDMRGTEMSYGGLNLTARDFARLGELYRNNGTWHGRSIVDPAWVHDSTTIDAPIREAGHPIVGDHAIDLGYGYQWWIPAGHHGDYCAIGVLNQLVYVNPATKTTIVKLSANRAYGTSTEETTNRDLENVEFLRWIARTI
ncbi:beta-lactamase family protein [Williamsia herbipolensis]|uniref:Beta-lactamase family protein n=1 Tax=Williamsia herbipolensis TaxID=1603258 RepID=A0AAU4JZ66_9NOCA|nr:serine hydrolase [Williamsia herbipolensis]